MVDDEWARQRRRSRRKERRRQDRVSLEREVSMKIVFKMEKYWIGDEN